VQAFQKESKCAYRCIKDGSCEVQIDAIYGGRNKKFPFGQAYTEGSCSSPYQGALCTFTPPECRPCKDAITCTPKKKVVCDSHWNCRDVNQPASIVSLIPYHYDIDIQSGEGFRVGRCLCENEQGGKCPLVPRPADRPWPVLGGDHPLNGECDGLVPTNCDSRNGTTPINRRKACLGGVSPREVVDVVQAYITAGVNDDVDVNQECPNAAFCVRGNRCCGLIALGNLRYGCPESC